MDNKRKRKIGYYTDRISAVCGILSFLIANIKKLEFIPYIGQIINFIIQYKYIFIILLVTIIILRYMICIIPRYEIYVKEKPELEAKPSIMSIAVIILLSTGAMSYSFINLDNTTMLSEAKNTQLSENAQMGTKEDQFEDEYIEEIGKSNILTEEDKIIDKYIKMAHDEIISEDILKTLSFNELYYIRNGILAYEGLYFESGYYEKFPWYNGHILSEEEIWSELNTFQCINIEHIKSLEQGKE